VGSIETPVPRYHPWRDLRDNWPEVQVRIAPLAGDLLGLLDYPVIVLRAGTSAAQRRCTLTHELVHLERDLPAGDAREELRVHAEVARRLLPLDLLIDAVRGAGPTDAALLAQALDVDTETLLLRLRLLTDRERAAVRAAAEGDGFPVA
jgi:hypothetical protein